MELRIVTGSALSTETLLLRNRGYAGVPGTEAEVYWRRGYEERSGDRRDRRQDRSAGRRPGFHQHGLPDEPPCVST